MDNLTLTVTDSADTLVGTTLSATVDTHTLGDPEPSPIPPISPAGEVGAEFLSMGVEEVAEAADGSGLSIGDIAVEDTVVGSSF